MWNKNFVWWYTVFLLLSTILFDLTIKTESFAPVSMVTAFFAIILLIMGGIYYKLIEDEISKICVKFCIVYSIGYPTLFILEVIRQVRFRQYLEEGLLKELIHYWGFIIFIIVQVLATIILIYNKMNKSNYYSK